VEAVSTALIRSVILLGTATAAFGCWQTEQPAVVVSTVSLTGLVTFDESWGALNQGKMTFALHRAITCDRSEARTKGAHEKPTLKLASFDSNGLFSSGQADPGRYWIVPGST